jgi:transcription antitermination factor NusG
MLIAMKANSTQASQNLELDAGERWFLVNSLPRCETKAEIHLGLQGFRTHVPRVIRTVRHARQLRTSHSPLFPSYLFIVINLDRDRWLSIQSTIGVRSLFMSDKRPIPVPRGVVEGLAERGRADHGGLDGLKTGQRVRMTSGPFTGLIGTLDFLDEKGRVRVLLDIMSTKVPVKVDRFRLLLAAK